MHRTWGSSLVTLQQLPHRRPSTAQNGTQRSSSPPPTLRIRFVNPSEKVSRSSCYSYFFTRTRHTASTIWGPGALTGKLLKQLGEKVERLAEYWIIRSKLNQIEKMQPNLLRSVRELSREETLEITDQCEKLVELCIIGMKYPTVFAIKAFGIILSGFKQPARQLWTYHIAEAISKREKSEVFEIFRDCFFFLLDESIFRIKGAVDLQTLSFRCPAVAHEIAVIISLLAKKDHVPRIVLVPSEPLSLELEGLSNPGDKGDNIKASFSTVIIAAGFFRLATHWVEHGLPHWDVRGKSCLEDALQDVADAQIYCGDLEKYSEEAKELRRKLRGSRLLLDAVPEAEEIPGLDLGFEATGQFTRGDPQ